MRKERKFRKIVKYEFPNGEEYKGNIIGFWMLRLTVGIIYILVSPISYVFSDYYGKRKVYFVEEK